MYSLCEMFTSALRTAYSLRQKVSDVNRLRHIREGPGSGGSKWRISGSVVQAINDLVVRIERLEDS